MSASASASSKAKRSEKPVRLVLFDVFGARVLSRTKEAPDQADTLCTPRLPIHEQYYEEAMRAGIAACSISSASVRKGFKPAFKEMDSAWPLYGKLSVPPISTEHWWTELIRRCMKHAGSADVEVEQAMPLLGPALLARFESDHGYRNFDDTLSCLQGLNSLGVKTSVVSNADPRILKTLESLGILPLLSSPPTLSWDVESSKPDLRIFTKACELCGEEPGEGVVMVGDELEADFRGARSANLEARLVRRSGEWSDGAARDAVEELGEVDVVRSMEELLLEVQERNGPS